MNSLFKKRRRRYLISILAFIASIACFSACSQEKPGKYFGKTEPPADNILRYISGGEPESLDPQIPNGQPEARILMSLYDGLVEYDPTSMRAIPAIAESWEVSPDNKQYIFHLRTNARFSNGDPITAGDFVFTFRRGFSPELASRNASLGFYVKYSEAFNSVRSFVRNPDGSFVLKSDVHPPENGQPEAVPEKAFGADTDFNRFITGAERLTVPSDQAQRQKLTDRDPGIKAAIEGKDLVPVKAEDIGVEAIDDRTFRLTLSQPAPFMVDLLPHQFFRVVPQKVIEKWGINWSRPEHIVTSGAFRVLEHRPYDVLRVRKDPMYWDADNVKLEGIDFYPMDEATTMMNLYKAGSVDALYNHTVPAAWFDLIKDYTAEYSLHPEAATEFYVINVKKPPMDIIKVRQAFALAIDRDALAQFKRTVKPLVDMTPESIFPKYEEARAKVYSEKLQAAGSSLGKWKARKFDPEEARKLLTEAGFPVTNTGSGFSCASFPVDQVSITYNTQESNKATAEFVQAQWKQNLGITIPLVNMEFRTFLPLLNKVDYSGFGRRGWVADYMDPYSFLGIYYSRDANQGATGWWDPKYDKILDDANNLFDPQKRYEKLAEAEFYIMQQQIIIPLFTNGTSWMKKPYVKGMYPNPGTLHAWKFIYIEHDPSKWTANMDTILTDDDPVVTSQLEALRATQVKFEEEQKAKAGEKKEAAK